MRRGGSVFLQVQTAGNGGQSRLPGALARKPARPGIYRSPGDAACVDAYNTAHPAAYPASFPNADEPAHTGADPDLYGTAHTTADGTTRTDQHTYRAAYTGAHIHRNPDGTAIDAHAAAYPACHHAAAPLRNAARVNGLTWP